MSFSDPLQELASMHEHNQFLPQHYQQRDEDNDVNSKTVDAKENLFDSLLLDFSTVWMETEDVDDAVDHAATSCIATPTSEACTIIDLTEAENNHYTSSMDDAVSVVSVGSVDDTETPQVQPLQAKPMRKKSSFMNTCWDIDNFMATAVNWDE